MQRQPLKYRVTLRPDGWYQVEGLFPKRRWFRPNATTWRGLDQHGRPADGFLTFTDRHWEADHAFQAVRRFAEARNGVKVVAEWRVEHA